MEWRSYAWCLAADREEAFSIFKPIGHSPSLVFVEGEPRSKAERYRAKNQLYLRPFFEVSFPRRMRGNVAVAAIFYRSTKCRIDIDNLLKQVLDSANTVAWNDDMQVTACLGLLRHDPVYPRSVIVVGPSDLAGALDRSNQDREGICETCGEPFFWRAYLSRKNSGRFCSIACSNRRVSDLREPILCRVCQMPFRRRTSSQTICSDNCRRLDMVDRNKGRQ